MPQATPTWFITGASNGLGKHIALEALSRGHKVVATARSGKKLAELASQGATTLTLDVTAPNDTIVSLVTAAVDAHGPFTHVVNAAGYGLDSTFEETTPDDVTRQFDTNVTGAINVTRAFLPHLREQRRGVIAIFGSLASWIGYPGMAYYAASKWADTALALSLRDEVKAFGIDVVAIEPGYFRTNFLTPGHRIAGSLKIADYEGTTSRDSRDLFDAVDRKQPGDPVKGARVMVDVLTGEGAAKGKGIPPRLILGSDMVQLVREDIERYEKLLEDWGEIACMTDHDDVKK